MVKTEQLALAKAPRKKLVKGASPHQIGVEFY
jgi:hypothetical protein